MSLLLFPSIKRNIKLRVDIQEELYRVCRERDIYKKQVDELNEEYNKLYKTANTQALELFEYRALQRNHKDLLNYTERLKSRIQKLEMGNEL